MVLSTETAHFIDWLESIQVTDVQAQEANRERGKLLQHLIDTNVKLSGFGKKVYTGELSPGCIKCAQGSWSCLFLTKKCTAACFYCPQEHSDDFIPRASRNKFPNLTAYIDFLAMNHIQGVSFSGGEPLIALDKVLNWMDAIRSKCGPDIYLWLYTNGDLVDRSTLAALKKAGLNEIRLNISARQYKLGPVILAKELIDTVTVEIPAIPEDVEIMEQVMHDLVDIGVDYLNLHQLYATEVNYLAMLERGYRFLSPALHAPVWESEMSALRLIQYSLEKELMLPINFCSLEYKIVSQDIPFRQMAGKLVLKKYEQLTTSGHIRRLSIETGQATIQTLVKLFETRPEIKSLWYYVRDMKAVYIHPSLLSTPELSPYKITIQYFDTDLRAADSEILAIYQAVELVELNPEYSLLAVSWLAAEEKDIPHSAVNTYFNSSGSDHKIKGGDWIERIRQYEEIPTGFRAITHGNGI